VLAKHSKHFSLEDSLAIGVDRKQRNFGPLKQQVAAFCFHYDPRLMFAADEGVPHNNSEPRS
jgi:hypothetical protein